jgi:hypothetical protein
MTARSVNTVEDEHRASGRSGTEAEETRASQQSLVPSLRHRLELQLGLCRRIATLRSDFATSASDEHVMVGASRRRAAPRSQRVGVAACAARHASASLYGRQRPPSGTPDSSSERLDSGSSAQAPGQVPILFALSTFAGKREVVTELRSPMPGRAWTAENGSEIKALVPKANSIGSGPAGQAPVPASSRRHCPTPRAPCRDS